MSKQTTYRKSGRTLERLKNSVNGNPRYRVTFNDGTKFLTAPDASIGYTIGNSEFDGHVDITVNGRGYIVDIGAAIGPKAAGYVCKECGGPSPMGVGYVDFQPGATERSAGLTECACGHSQRA